MSVLHRPSKMPAGLAFGLGLGLAWVPALADPMKPLTAMLPSAQPVSADPAASAAANGLGASRLSATRTDASGRWEALLGTRWLRRGDPLDGARVLEIDANRVLLLRDGRRETLFLLPPLTPERSAAPAAPQAAAPAAPF